MEESKIKFVRTIFFITFDWMDSSDVERLFGIMKDEVLNDLEECAEPEDWTASDAQIAIRRVLFEKLGIES